jgi:predicted glycoside hydrolase/deacetylase ChbG (UPF0249 family)
MKKTGILLAFLFSLTIELSAQKLIVRGDDMATAHAINTAVIKAYTDGIERSAEVIVVGAWLPEAVKMLKEQPGLDVGLHVAFTSEWETMKWHPLTHCPSLTDENGYFPTSVFPNPNYPGSSMMERKDKINIAEVEAELRAQIVLAKQLLPNLTHLSGHMMWAAVSDEIAALADRLSQEYGLPFVDDRGDTNKRLGIEGVPIPWGLSPLEREARFIEVLKKLEKGKTYIYIEHPAFDGEEMRAIRHKGYENVAEDRQAVLNMFTDPAIKKIIEEKGIRLVSYGDVISEIK